MLPSAQRLVIVVLEILDLPSKLQKLTTEATLNELFQGFIDGFTLSR